MKGILRWQMVNPDTNEFQYDLGSQEFDTDTQSIRDKLLGLLLHEWDSFGEDGDCILVKVETPDED